MGEEAVVVFDGREAAAPRAEPGEVVVVVGLLLLRGRACVAGSGVGFRNPGNESCVNDVERVVQF